MCDKSIVSKSPYLSDTNWDTYVKKMMSLKKLLGFGPYLTLSNMLNYNQPFFLGYHYSKVKTIDNVTVGITYFTYKSGRTKPVQVAETGRYSLPFM